ncbi:MAG: coenzyme F420-0:L-glutamate ligase [Acidobacteria bacterium]|nr:coenzyme F420-0:L-glutamate ligase [Acidobacteriota bacterium]
MEKSYSPPERLLIWAVPGLPEIRAGERLAELLCRKLAEHDLPIANHDVLVVAQKIISKAEGRMVELKHVSPSAYACSVAEEFGKDPRQVEVVLRESRRIVRMDAGVMVVETHHGLVCANAGVDASNVPEGWVSLLPENPDASASRLRDEMAEITGKQVAVIIADTFGRPWREGLTNVAIGVAGFSPLLDYRGQKDEQGHVLSATVIATADELAAASELVMGKTARRPAAIIRNFPWASREGSAAELIRPRKKDLFR